MICCIKFLGLSNNKSKQIFVYKRVGRKFGRNRENSKPNQITNEN